MDVWGELLGQCVGVEKTGQFASFILLEMPGDSDAEGAILVGDDHSPPHVLHFERVDFCRGSRLRPMSPAPNSPSGWRRLRLSGFEARLRRPLDESKGDVMRRRSVGRRRKSVSHRERADADLDPRSGANGGAFIFGSVRKAREKGKGG